MKRIVLLLVFAGCASPGGIDEYQSDLSTILVGDSIKESSSDAQAQGRAIAASSIAVATGSATSATCWVQTGSTSAHAVMGVYADAAGHPGALLAQTTNFKPTAGAWNTMALPAASITSGARYWVALLGYGSGVLYYREAGGPSTYETSMSSTLTALPATWVTGRAYSLGPVSCYLSGTSVTQDMTTSVVTDLTVPRDLSVVTDLSVPRDLAVALDLTASPADLTSTTNADLSPPSTSCATPIATTMPTGTIIYVDHVAAAGGDGSLAAPYQTIQAGLNAAPTGSTVAVAEGTYLESTAPNETRNLTLMGGFASGFGARNTSLHQVVIRSTGIAVSMAIPGSNGHFTLDGVRLTGGTTGLARTNGDAWQLGGGITITDSVIDSEIASGNGGCVATNNTPLTISNSWLHDCQAGRGGGFAFTDATNSCGLTITNNCIESNQGVEPTSSHGGGGYFSSVNASITGNLIRNNYSTSWGAGLGCVGGVVAFSRNTYTGNSAGGYGSALMCDDGAACTLDGETMTGNIGPTIYFDDTETRLTMRNSTVSGTVSAHGGGAGFLVTFNSGNPPPTSYPLITISNCTFSNAAQDFSMSTGTQPSAVISVTGTHLSFAPTLDVVGDQTVGFGAGNSW